MMPGITKIIKTSLALLFTASVAQVHAEDLGTIWFVGDSITQSNADGDSSGSPRKSLYDLLTANGHSFDYTGHHVANVDGLPTTGSTTSDNLYHYHSGVSGIRIGEVGGDSGFATNLTTYWNSGRLAVAKPDKILIMLGTNDVALPSGATDRLKTLIQNIYALPNVGNPTIFLASIAPNGRNAADIAYVVAFNSFVSGIVYDFQTEGKDIHYVDQFTPLNDDYANAMGSDNVHPNSVGNDAIAQTWFNAITSGVIVDGVSTNTDSAYGSFVSATDLVNAGATTLASGPAYNVTPYFGTAANNDGAIGATSASDITFWLNASVGETYSISYALDTSVNTLGYNITSLQTIHGWNGQSGNQKNQNYTVEVSTVNDSGFVPIATVAYLPFSSASSAGSTKVTVTDATGILASGVDEIRFTYTIPGTGGSQASPTIREIDVFGVPTAATTLVQLRKRNALGYCINGQSGATDGQNVTLYQYIDGHQNLTWEEIDRGNGYYSYQKKGTTYSLCSDTGGANNQNVYLWTTSSSDYNQQWKKVDMGNGYYQLQKRNALDYCINGGSGAYNNRSVTLWDSSNPSYNLQWLVEYK